MENENLSELIWDLGRAYYAFVGLAERVLVSAKLDHAIRPGMGHVLFALYEEDDRTIKEIAARSQLAPSPLTGLLTRMEKAGLVERHRDESDGGLVRVRLTSFGRGLETKCRKMLQKVTGIADAGVGEDNVPQAKKMLQGMADAFNNEERRLAKQQCQSKNNSN